MSAAPKIVPAMPEPMREEPKNIDFEQALLGAVFRENGSLETISTILEPDHFFDPLHARIFVKMGQMVQLGAPVTPITLFAAMKSDPGVIETGGQGISTHCAAPLQPAMDRSTMPRDSQPRRPQVSDQARRAHHQRGL
jgi:replicative DNA helicase